MNIISLTSEQQKIYDKVVSLIEGGAKVIDITGPAGCGKTTVLNRLVDLYGVSKSRVCAFTGVAASLHRTGVTCHKLLATSGISIKKIFKDEFLDFLKRKNCSIYPFNPKLSDKQKAWVNMLKMEFLQGLIEMEENVSEEASAREIESKREAKYVEMLRKLEFEEDYSDIVLFIDESSMLPKFFAELFLRMGFKCVVFVGDKYQLPPVVMNTENKGFYFELLPNDCPRFELKEIIRQNNQDVLILLHNACREKGEKKELAVQGLNEYFRKVFKPEPEKTQIHYTNKRVTAANEHDLVSHEKTVLYPQVVLKKNWKEIKMRFNWLQLAISEEDLIERIENHYKLIQPVILRRDGQCMNLINISGGPQNGHIVPLICDKEHIWPEKISMGGRQDKWIYPGTRMMWSDVPYEVMGGERYMHTSNHEYFSVVLPMAQHSFAYTMHKSQGKTILNGTRTGIYKNKWEVGVPGLTYVALTRNQNFEDLNLHGELVPADFEYSFGEVRELKKFKKINPDDAIIKSK